MIISNWKERDQKIVKLRIELRNDPFEKTSWIDKDLDYSGKDEIIVQQKGTNFIGNIF